MVNLKLRPHRRSNFRRVLAFAKQLFGLALLVLELIRRLLDLLR